MSIWSSKEFESWIIQENYNEIPDAFYLGLNPITSFEKATAITHLRNLEYLKIYSYIGKSLPYGFFMLQNLTFLTITAHSHDESLEIFPPEIYKLTKLLQLKISGHRFNRIDSEIGNLQNLHDLDLSHNLISKIPESFAFLNLTQLNLSHNVSIKMDTILAISSLISLDVRDVDTITSGNGMIPPSLEIFLYGDSLPEILKDSWDVRGPEINYSLFRAKANKELRAEALEVMEDELEKIK